MGTDTDNGAGVNDFPAPMDDDRNRAHSVIRVIKDHWASIVFVVAMGLSLWASYAGYRNSHQLQENQEKMCKFFDQSRSDNRDTWLFVINGLGFNPNSPQIIALKNYVLEHLEDVQCVAGSPEPVNG